MLPNIYLVMLTLITWHICQLASSSPYDAVWDLWHLVFVRSYQNPNNSLTSATISKSSHLVYTNTGSKFKLRHLYVTNSSKHPSYFAILPIDFGTPCQILILPLLLLALGLKSEFFQSYFVNYFNPWNPFSFHLKSPSHNCLGVSAIIIYIFILITNVWKPINLLGVPQNSCLVFLSQLFYITCNGCTVL